MKISEDSIFVHSIDFQMRISSSIEKKYIYNVSTQTMLCSIVSEPHPYVITHTRCRSQSDLCILLKKIDWYSDDFTVFFFFLGLMCHYLKSIRCASNVLLLFNQLTLFFFISFDCYDLFEHQNIVGVDHFYVCSLLVMMSICLMSNVS